MGRMNANPNEGDEYETYETHRFCSHHGCGYSGIVDSRLREWATKRDVHNNANHRYITTTTNNYINANHQDKDSKYVIGNKSPRYRIDLGSNLLFRTD
jgi:hypothetical protein